VTPIDFLELLWPSKPADLYLLIWTLHDKKSRWYLDLHAAADAVQKVHGRDVYVGVGLAGRDYGPDQSVCFRRDRRHSRASGPISIEVGSPQSEATSGHDRRSAQHHPGGISRPPFVIATGNGVHAWWLFKEPWIFENADERKDASSLIVASDALSL